MATLKISELSVGDWVKIKECAYFPFDKPNDFLSPYAKVTALEGENCLIWLNTQDGEFCASLKNIEPIPITAEILEKNGFEKISKTQPWFRYKTDITVARYADDLWGFGIGVACNELWGLSGVHDLQHAMRLAGVDKEINL